MNKYILLFSLLCLLVWSCGKDEDTLSPSGLEKDWLVLEDSDNPIDHLRYEIYTSTGVPIYYNDTVGSEERYSYGSGMNYTYYEVLQVFYSPGATTPGPLTARYSLPAGGRENSNMEDVLVFLRDEVLPEVPEGTYLPSILLADTLVTPTGDSMAYKGLNTTVLGQVYRFNEMDESEKNLLKGAFLATTIMSILTTNEAEWLEEEFYALSYAVNPTETRIYSTETSSYMAYAGISSDMISRGMVSHIGTLGFIGCKTKPSTVGSGNSLPVDPYKPNQWYQPTRSQDVQQYCQAILAYSEEEFMERYAKATILGYDSQWIAGQGSVETPNPDKDQEVEFPVVREKYYVMKAKLEEYGFTFE